MAQMNYVYKNAGLRVETSTMEFQHIQELDRRLKYFNKHTALAASQCKFLEEHLDQLHSDVGSTRESSIRGGVLECTVQAEPEVFAQTLVMTLVSGARSAGQRERCGQKNCKTPALSVVVHMCRYVDVLYTHSCAVTECSFVCTFGSSYRVPETNCVHPFASSLFS